MTADPLDDLDDSTAIRVGTRNDEAIIWGLDDEHVYYLDKTNSGTWNPRPTVISREIASEILTDADCEQIDPEEIPGDRREL